MIAQEQPSRPGRRCIVVGGGLAGLTAAYTLSQDPAYDVVLLESTGEIGGKLRVRAVAGITIDVGAESMLSRRPEGVALAREIGLAVTHPTHAKPTIWSRGAMRSLPRSLMGVPQDLSDLKASGVLSSTGLARAAREAELPPSDLAGGDVSVGTLVSERMGKEVVDRLVEPLLGGVYAGRAHEISARAAIPVLVDQAMRGSWLSQAPGGLPSTAPVFAGLLGGMGSLPTALVRTDGFTVRYDAVVQAIERRPGGFQILVNTNGQRSFEFADDVIVATPAAASARLLKTLVPAAALPLAEIEAASVAVVTLAVPLATVANLSSSGFLVPPVERRDIKAATFSWAKWDWVHAAGEADGIALLRASVGRHREELALQRTNEELIGLAREDLADLCGLIADPIDTHVQRWGGGLPQYAVGHLDRVARIRAALDLANVEAGPNGGRLAVCGATYDGVGIPAVVASARLAATTVAQWTP